MSEHTPGPWRVHPAPYGWDIFNPWGDEIKPQWVAAVHTTVGAMSVRERLGMHPSREECAANARLIAASPDLLEALRQCQRVLHDLTRGDKSLSTLHIYTHAIEAEAKARAAIARAEGSAP